MLIDHEKQVMDNGTASTVAEAESIFRGYKIEIDFQPQGDDELGQQAMLLTCVALAKRVFLSGVRVYGVLSGTQNTPLGRQDQKPSQKFDLFSPRQIPRRQVQPGAHPQVYLAPSGTRPSSSAVRSRLAYRTAVAG